VQEKLYPSHFFAVHEALQEIFLEGKMADKTLERVLKADRRRGANDRAIIAFWVYELVRWHRTCSFLAEVDEEEIDSANTGKRIEALCLFNKWPIPALRECHTLVKSAVQQRILEHETWPHEIRASIPNWLEELGRAELQERWEPTMAALNRPAPLHVRLNRLIHTSPEFPEAADFKHCAYGPEAPDAYELPGRPAIFKHPLYRQGILEVQDAGSQQIAPFLQVEPGMRVIDACAGAGGKSLHLSALLKNTGKLICMDVHEYKLVELRRRAKRARATNIEIRLISDTKTIKRQAGQADRLLLDVPCSGLGVLRRNPDAKWKLNTDFLHRVQEIQKTILNSYGRMLKPNGKMVYATCSILPSENQNQVMNFLQQNPGFELEEEKFLFPDQQDGFYMARLRKLN